MVRVAEVLPVGLQRQRPVAGHLDPVEVVAVANVVGVGLAAAAEDVREQTGNVGGAEAYRRDIPDAEVRLLDTGHFALETHSSEIASAMQEFLGRVITH